MSHYTTLESYKNLYNTDSLPSAQPRTPLNFSEFIDIPDSQQTT